MRKSITVALTVILFAAISFAGKAQSSHSNHNEGSGVVISFNPNSNSGLIMDDSTGEVFEFHNAGIEILEINESYIYIMQVTANGKVIIRDIHKKRVPENIAGPGIN
jgi:hypothetical protein